jgi:hypothetical protein
MNQFAKGDVTDSVVCASSRSKAALTSKIQNKAYSTRTTALLWPIWTMMDA